MNVDKIEQPKLAKHDAAILDLVFVMDCTGSMGSYIENARNSIRQIVEEIVISEKSDVRLALVEYRDHPPQETTFVTRAHDFTASIKEMRTWLDACAAVGGGDCPEAVADGLHDALKLSWREKSTKICVLISDAPPHGLSQNSDTMPNGCPLGIDPLQVVQQMAEKGITLYSIGCEPAILPYKEFFVAIAYKTGGQYIPLRNANLLAKVIVGSAQEEISLEKLMEDVQNEVESTINSCGGKVDEAVLASAVQKKLFQQGARTKNLKCNNSNLERASESAINYSKMSSLSEINKNFKTTESPLSYKVSSFAAAPSMPMPRGMRQMKMTSAAEAPPPPPHASLDSYTVETDFINIEQSERLVQKALKRKTKK